MQIIDKMDLGSEGAMYAVEIEDGFFVDVKVKDTGLVYVMQNEDGSTVYDGRCADYTYPGFEYDEKAVVDLVKEAMNKGVDKIMVAIESTDDYSNSEFHSRLVDLDIQNEDGTFGKVVESYRIACINENGRIDKYDDRMFESAGEARAAVLGNKGLELVSYDDLVHEAGKGLGAVLKDAQVRAAEGVAGKAGKDFEYDYQSL